MSYRAVREQSLEGGDELGTVVRGARADERLTIRRAALALGCRASRGPGGGRACRASADVAEGFQPIHESDHTVVPQQQHACEFADRGGLGTRSNGQQQLMLLWRQARPTCGGFTECEEMPDAIAKARPARGTGGR